MAVVATAVVAATLWAEVVSGVELSAVVAFVAALAVDSVAATVVVSVVATAVMDIVVATGMAATAGVVGESASALAGVGRITDITDTHTPMDIRTHIIRMATILTRIMAIRMAIRRLSSHISTGPLRSSNNSMVLNTGRNTVPNTALNRTSGQPLRLPRRIRLSRILLQAMHRRPLLLRPATKRTVSGIASAPHRILS